MHLPTDILVKGSQKLEPYLVPHGFRFQFGGDGKSSGGEFARAEFVRGERRLELHFRWSLGLVRFHVENQSAFHETYMRELGVWEQCLYPGFSDDPLEAFDELAHDLTLADDFLTGAAAVLQHAAIKEKVDEISRRQDLMAEYVGDTASLELLRTYFREKQYSEVIKIARSLKYPSRMAQSELTMVEISRKRRGT